MANIYELPLPDGSIVQVEGDREPTREEWLRAIGPKVGFSPLEPTPVVTDEGLLARAQRNAVGPSIADSRSAGLRAAEEMSAIADQQNRVARLEGVRQRVAFEDARNAEIDRRLGVLGQAYMGNPTAISEVLTDVGSSPVGQLVAEAAPPVATAIALGPASLTPPGAAAVMGAGALGSQLSQRLRGQDIFAPANLTESLVQGALSPVGIGPVRPGAGLGTALATGLREGVGIGAALEASRGAGATMRGEEYSPDAQTAMNFGIASALGVGGRGLERAITPSAPKPAAPKGEAANQAAQAANAIKESKGANAQATLTQLSTGQADAGLREIVPPAAEPSPVDNLIASRAVVAAENRSPAAKERILQQLVDDVSLAEAKRSADRIGVEVNSDITERARRRVLAVRKEFGDDVDGAIQNLTTRIEESTPAPVAEVRPTTQERRATPQAETEAFNKRQADAFEALREKGVPVKEAREAARALAGTTDPQEYQLIYQGALERYGKVEKVAPAAKATTRQLRSLQELTPETIGVPPAARPDVDELATELSQQQSAAARAADRANYETEIQLRQAEDADLRDAAVLDGVSGEAQQAKALAEQRVYADRLRRATDVLRAEGLPLQAARALAATATPDEYNFILGELRARYGAARQQSTRQQPTRLRSLEELTPEAVGITPAALPEPTPVSNALPEPTPASAQALPDPQQVRLQEAVQEAPQAQVKRAKDFANTGNYDVSIGERKFKIFRDPEDDMWYNASRSGGGGSEGFLGFNRNEAVEKLRTVSTEGPSARQPITADRRAKIAELARARGMTRRTPSGPLPEPIPAQPLPEIAPATETPVMPTETPSLPASKPALSIKDRDRLRFLDNKFARGTISAAEDAERRGIRGRSRAVGEMGGISRELLQRIGAPAIGGAIGASQGETPEERLGFALAGVAAGVGGQAALRAAGRSLNASSLGKSIGKTGTFIREGFEDNRIRFFRSLEERGGKPVEREARMAMELATPSAEGQMRVFFKEEVPRFREFVGLVARNRQITEADAEFGMKTYAYARHAKDYNRVHGNGASGLTNDEVNSVLAQYAITGEDDSFEMGANWLTRVFREGLEARRAAGVINEKTYNTLTKEYPNYVSLQRILPEMDEDMVDSAITPRPRGPEVRGTGVRSAKGSDLPIKDIFETAVENLNESYRRAALNKANLVAFGDILKNPDRYDGLYSVRRPFPVEKTRVGADGQKTKYTGYPDPSENEFKFYENGKPVYVRFEDRNVLEALRNVQSDAARAIIGVMSVPSRMMSLLFTTGSTAFPVRQFFRDPQEVAFNLDALFGSGAGRKVLKEQIPSLKNLTDYATMNMVPRRAARGASGLLNQDPNPWSSTVVGADAPELKMVREFYEDGGSTGGLVATTAEMGATLFDDMTKLAKLLPKDSKVLTRIARVTPDAAATFIRVIGGINRMVEDAPRFSAYKVARGMGRSREEAAAIARQSSFDPQRKGRFTPAATAGFIFFNPAIQSAKRIIKSGVRSPATVAKAAAAIGGAYWAAHMWNNAVAGENWREKVDGYSAKYGIPLILPNEGGDLNYVTMPIAHGTMPLLRVAQIAADAGIDGKLPTPGDVVKNLSEAAVESYSPFPLDQGLGVALTPTSIRPLTDIERNRDAFDRPIMPNTPGADQMLQYKRYFDSTPRTRSGRLAIKMAENMYKTSGGSVDVSPDALLYLWRSYLGDPGKQVRAGIDLPENPPSEFGEFEKVVNTERGTWLPAALPVTGAIFRSVPAEMAEARGVGAVVEDKARQEEATFQAEYSRRVRELGRLIANTVPEQRQELVQTMAQNGAFVYGDVSPEDVFDSVIDYAMSDDRTLPERERKVRKAIAQSPVRGGFRARELARLYNETPEAERPAFAQAFILEESDEVIEQVLALLPQAIR